ncbi:hypothetical protein AWC38_SpisGene326 [Stylophora pistillata]|uniref:C2H2-type domain-containing protein n=1 Tax=Stylophora pistillata TaxID=50429 RepID=A0A2B4T0E9_STYPI|nr:hypothetical protein AWC38_SpisGene326 [Stylophora pistillata]
MMTIVVLLRLIFVEWEDATDLEQKQTAVQKKKTKEKTKCRRRQKRAMERLGANKRRGEERAENNKGLKRRSSSGADTLEHLKERNEGMDATKHEQIELKREELRLQAARQKAAIQQQQLQFAHTSVKFTMEVEKNSKLPFLGTELLNHAPRIETKVYVKPTNTGLLLHYQSHVDNRYKRSLLKTMLDRAHRLSSSWAHFSDECDRLKKVFARLKYPERLVNSTINTFLQSRIVGTQPTQTPKEPISIVRVVIPFKDQESANYVKKELKNLSMKVQTTVQPVFVSRKVGQDLKVREIKPQIVNQQRVVYQFQCDLCDAGYVGYTRGHLHTRVDGHKRKASSIYKHYHERHSEVPKDLLKRFSILKKCSNKFDCLVNEMLFIRDLKPTLNVQSDSIRAKVFV